MALNVIDEALAVIAGFEGDPRCSLNCHYAEALATEVKRLREEADSDTARLNWLEDQRRGIEAGTMDDHEGNPTRKLWVVDGADQSCLMYSIREAIDRAMTSTNLSPVVEGVDAFDDEGGYNAAIPDPTNAGMGV